MGPLNRHAVTACAHAFKIWHVKLSKHLGMMVSACSFCRLIAQAVHSVMSCMRMRSRCFDRICAACSDMDVCKTSQHAGYRMQWAHLDDLYASCCFTRSAQTYTQQCRHWQCLISITTYAKKACSA